MTCGKTNLFQPFEYIYQYIELKEVPRQLIAGENRKLLIKFKKYRTLSITFWARKLKIIIFF